jgi:hypothetical protein
LQHIIWTWNTINDELVKILQFKITYFINESKLDPMVKVSRFYWTWPVLTGLESISCGFRSFISEQTGLMARSPDFWSDRLIQFGFNNTNLKFILRQLVEHGIGFLGERIKSYNGFSLWKSYNLSYENMHLK